MLTVQFQLQEFWSVFLCQMFGGAAWQADKEGRKEDARIAGKNFLAIYKQLTVEQKIQVRNDLNALSSDPKKSVSELIEGLTTYLDHLNNTNDDRDKNS